MAGYGAGIRHHRKTSGAKADNGRKASPFLPFPSFSSLFRPLVAGGGRMDYVCLRDTAFTGENKRIRVS